MEQIDRTRRYLARLERAYAGVSTQWSRRGELEDDMLAFFLHCHHIGDWIHELSKVPVTVQEVAAFIKQHECLAICADLSNGTKHCRVTRTLRTVSQPHVVSRTYEGTEVPDSTLTVIQATFSIIATGKSHDALDLARECMQTWEGYLSSLRNRYKTQPTTDEAEPAQG